MVAFGRSALGILAGTGIDASGPTVCLIPGSRVRFGTGTLAFTSGSFWGIGGANAVAALRALGGSYAVKNTSVQYESQGSICLMRLGIAISGRYGSPGSGLYQCSS